MRFALLLFAVCAWCASPLDQAILNQMGPSRIASRTPVSTELDLVVAYAGPGNLGKITGGAFWWHGKMRLGIFLQRRDRPGMVYKIAVESGPSIDEGLIRVERATATDVLFLCSPEKGPSGPYRKYVYDIRAKALVGTVVYKPYAMERVAVSGEKAIVIGADRDRPVALEFAGEATPPFRLLRGAEALRLMVKESKPVRFGVSNQFLLSRVEGQPTVVVGPGKRYALPRSTYEEFAAARPEQVKYGPSRDAATMDEQIGPSHLVEGTMWFGKTFYDGEGHTGVGGFGYFDVGKKAYKMFSPAAVRNYSVSAILVEAEAVWLGLVHRGEWRSGGGGLIRFDRATERAERYELREIVNGIARMGDRMLLATELGVAALEGSTPRRYIIDETTDGRLRVLELSFGQE